MNDLYDGIRSDKRPGDKRPTKKQRREGEDWGWGAFELAHGYGWFDDGYDYIARIDDMRVFSSDRTASHQAAKDGFVFLVLTPKQKKLCRDNLACCDPYTMLDTPQNRELVAKLEKGGE